MVQIKSKLMLKLSIVFCGLVCIADMIVTPLATDIFTEYAGMSEFWLNFILTGPAIVALPVILLVSIAARYVSKKVLLLIGVCAGCIGGLGCAFATSFPMLIAFRAINGIAYGMVQPMGYALCAELFDDPEERAGMMGLLSAGCAVGTIIFSLCSGIIAKTGWHHSFLLNLILVVGLIGCAIYVPMTPPEGKRAKENVKGAKSKYPVKGVALRLFVFCLFGTLYYAVLFTIDLFITDTGLGDSTLSGILSALGSLASFLVGISFGKIFIKLQHKIPFIMFGLAAVGFFIMSLANASFVIMIGMFICGASASLCDPYFTSTYGQIVPKEHLSITMSLHTLLIQAQNYISPFAFTAVMAIFSCTNRVEGVRSMAIVMAIGAVCCFIFYALKGKQWDLSEEDLKAQQQEGAPM